LLYWLEDQVNDPAHAIEKAFDEIKMPINYIQLATAAFTAVNSTYTKY